MARMIDADKLIKALDSYKECNHCRLRTNKGCCLIATEVKVCMAHSKAVKQLADEMAKEAEND